MNKMENLWHLCPIVVSISPHLSVMHFILERDTSQITKICRYIGLTAENWCSLKEGKLNPHPTQALAASSTPYNHCYAKAHYFHHLCRDIKTTTTPGMSVWGLKTGGSEVFWVRGRKPSLYFRKPQQSHLCPTTANMPIHQLSSTYPGMLQIPQHREPSRNKPN